MSIKDFKRVKTDAILLGVCSGIAYSFGLKTWIVRGLLLLLVVCYGIGILPYIILGLLAPEWKEEPLDYEEICK